eukprot:Phypoly_transcript_09725.p1 GENE.Phypoly_transcript_09725~~Phypoly_transcript_09725.p1  ORF type:complete len:299 (+),score=24.64 Phypoly_transcript_09725:114-1010(+)
MLDVESCAAALRCYLQNIIDGKDTCADLTTRDCLWLLEVDEELVKAKAVVTQLLFHAALSSLDTTHLENIVSLEVENDNPFNMIGYPTKPLVVEIAKSFVEWERLGECPVRFLAMTLLVETENDPARIQTFTPLFLSQITNWEAKDLASRAEAVGLVLKSLTKKGICTLLKLRRTQGSQCCFPVGLGTLLKACNSLHAPESAARLTVAGRALSKHAQRSVDGWWGEAQGTEILKNSRAEKMILKILQNATWINIHSLPHELPCLEVRIAEGYGARWLADGAQFRGFLEPQMEDGHEKR